MSSDDPKLIENKPTPSRLRRLAEPRIWWLSVATIILATAGYLGRWWWLLDLFSHYRVYYLAFMLPAAVLLFYWQRKILALILLGYATLQAIEVVPSYISSNNRLLSGPSLRFTSLNVHTSNQRFDAVAQFVEASSADVVLLLEVNQNWLDQLTPSLVAYPYRLEQPRADNFGIAIYSRLPFIESQILNLPPDQLPSVSVAVELGSQPLRIIGTHPLPPTGAAYTNSRDTQLAHVAEIVASSQIPCLLAGDLNTTPWSYSFKDLLSTAKLKDSRMGFGIQPSWFLAGNLIRIPIDHVLLTEQLETKSRWVGPDIGSDHRAIIIDICMPE